MKALRDNGVTVSKISEIFDMHRQSISTYCSFIDEFDQKIKVGSYTIGCLFALVKSEDIKAQYLYMCDEETILKAEQYYIIEVKSVTNTATIANGNYHDVTELLQTILLSTFNIPEKVSITCTRSDGKVMFKHFNYSIENEIKNLIELISSEK